MFYTLSSVDEEELHPLSDRGWATALKYAETWVRYDGIKAQIARDFYQRIADSPQADPSTQASHIKPLNARFHRKCYQKFTDKNKKEQAERAAENKQQKRPVPDLTEDDHGKLI